MALVAFSEALALHRSGRIAEAEAAYRKAIALDPQNAVAYLNLGVALRALGRHRDAVSSYDDAIAIRPAYAEAYSNRANALMDIGELHLALTSLDQALALNAALPEAHSNRGNILNRLQRYEEAEAAADRAIDLNPAFEEAYFHRGGARYGLSRAQEAVGDYDQALRLNPRHVMALYNRGLAYHALGRLDEAEASFDQAVALRPDYAEAHWSRALSLLLAGDFARGWEEYEWRWKGERGRRKNASPSQPLWVPREALAGRSVLIHAEQGIGDQIMFASMLGDLSNDAAAVTCLCDPRLLALFSASFPGVRFLPDSDRPPARMFDAIVALGGLGRLYRRSLADFDGEPYLRPPTEVVAKWRGWLGPSTGLHRIGLAWRGGTTETNTAGRSSSLDALMPLLQRSDCEFVSLQHGDVAEEIAKADPSLPRPIRQPPPDALLDFEQTAGLIQSLDLVVSVQTSVIHLSGALGAPCWVMVPFNPEWRYGAVGERMPWYRSVRLFRQTAPGDWHSVIAQLGGQLDILVDA